MCEFSQRLIAWLDHELPVEEALKVELHLDACAECGRDLRTYEQLSSTIDAYCDAAMESGAPRSEPRWKPALLGAGAVAAVLALVLVSPQGRVRKSPANATLAAAPASASRVAAEVRVPLNSAIPSAARSSFRTSVESTGLPKQENLSSITAREKTAFSAAALGADWRSPEPAIQITIPADAVLPPGAAPEGVSFVAEVSIAPDGSAQQIVVQP